VVFCAPLELTARFSFSECFSLGNKEIVIDCGCLVRDVSFSGGFLYREVANFLCEINCICSRTSHTIKFRRKYWYCPCIFHFQYCRKVNNTIGDVCVTYRVGASRFLCPRLFSGDHVL
jgi:hypothetical protein